METNRRPFRKQRMEETPFAVARELPTRPVYNSKHTHAPHVNAPRVFFYYANFAGLESPQFAVARMGSKRS